MAALVPDAPLPVSAVVAIVPDAALAATAALAEPGMPGWAPLLALPACVAAGADAVAIVAGAAGMAPGAPPGAASAPGMVVANGADEKLLGGNGGREGAPVDEVFDAAGLRGGICDSWTMLTLVSLFAIA
jgi:hypothetical protein